MSPLASLLGEASRLLSARGSRFALVGGLAVSARTEPRFTRDVDLAVVARDDRDAEATVDALVPPFVVFGTLEHDTLGRLAAVRLGRPGSAVDPVVDLLFASSGIETEVVEHAEVMELFPEVRVRVATTGHLIALKLLARAPERPQDDVDLQALLAAASGDDLRIADEAIAEIEARGGSRGRDLRREWRGWRPNRP